MEYILTPEELSAGRDFWNGRHKFLKFCTMYETPSREIELPTESRRSYFSQVYLYSVFSEKEVCCSQMEVSLRDDQVHSHATNSTYTTE